MKMHTIHTDIKLTRRKSLSSVIGDNNELLFSAPSLGRCIEWLMEQGEFQFYIRTEDRCIGVTATFVDQ